MHATVRGQALFAEESTNDRPATARLNEKLRSIHPHDEVMTPEGP